ncbi:MAG: NADAR family protein [Carboxylicivirga sp.]|jgi:ribA/ribD-fused uncharacterized protein|nr:NADAR family protein [Carboxylicivirga sp.]MCT4645190.1 NADAR family protein [Carboxylicivirga sp.]
MKYNIYKTIKEFQAGTKQKFLFFWGHQKQRNGEISQSCMSQWWPADFEIEGVRYKSSEHFMMAEKARLFDDLATREKIIQSKSPGEAKQLGRGVIGFKEDVWLQQRYEIVKCGNFEKFGQNKDLAAFLLSTKNRILVEASSVDTIWGIGLSKESEHCKNPLMWRGLNLLGFALMEVRDELLETK